MAFPISSLFTNAGRSVVDDPAYKQENVKQRLQQPGSASLRARLVECSQSDPKHITPGATGPEVAILQLALDKLASASSQAVPFSGQPFTAHDKLAQAFNDAIKAVRATPVSASERDKGTYGESTARRILAYKKARDLRRGPGVAVDSVVGKQTIAWIDRDLWTAENGRLPGDAPPTPSVSTPRDIFIRFRGAGQGDVEGSRDLPSQTQFSNAVNTPEYLATHKSVLPICFIGGRGGTDRSAEAVQEAVAARQADPSGIMVIVGISVGGFAALNAAKLLTEKGIHIDYVAISDGAFFDAERDIVSFSPLRIRQPEPITANRKDCYFQTWGHELLVDARGAGGFMTGTEFHGSLTGFTLFDLNTRGRMPTIKTLFSIAALGGSPQQTPLPIRMSFAGDAHVAAVETGNTEIRAVMKSLIKP